MLLKMAHLRAIQAGQVDLVFRRWKKPTVRAGGTLNTALGQLAIDAVDVVEAGEVTDGEAVRAGYASADALRADLPAGEGPVYRVALGGLNADPRQALRADTDLSDVLPRLARLDARAPWTRRYLDLIAEHPARRAGDLADMLGLETLVFKTNVRKLKALGLTESLEVGYRLSPRGEVLRRSAS